MTKVQLIDAAIERYSLAKEQLQEKFLREIDEIE